MARASFEFGLPREGHLDPSRWAARVFTNDAWRVRLHAIGRLPPDVDPRQLALATLAALEGGLLLAQVQRDPEPLAAALDAMLTLITTLSDTTSTPLDH
jgi:hypothetical protein